MPKKLGISTPSRTKGPSSLSAKKIGDRIGKLSVVRRSRGPFRASVPGWRTALVPPSSFVVLTFPGRFHGFPSCALVPLGQVVPVESGGVAAAPSSYRFGQLNIQLIEHHILVVGGELGIVFLDQRGDVGVVEKIDLHPLQSKASADGQLSEPHRRIQYLLHTLGLLEECVPVGVNLFGVPFAGDRFDVGERHDGREEADGHAAGLEGGVEVGHHLLVGGVAGRQNGVDGDDQVVVVALGDVGGVHGFVSDVGGGSGGGLREISLGNLNHICEIAAHDLQFGEPLRHSPLQLSGRPAARH